MALANCKECDRLFNQVTRDICPNCMRKEDDALLLVTNFLRANKGYTPQQVHESTGVELRLIYKFIREGRLIAKNYPNMTYPCEQCNLPIQLGRFCTSCQSKLADKLHKAANSESMSQETVIRSGYHSRS